MINLSNIGRIFYGAAIAEIGIQTIGQHDFPYILQMPQHFPVSAQTILAIIFGVICTLAGLCIIFKKWTGQASLLFGGFLLLLFFLYYIPYQFLTSSNYLNLGEWENAEKELAFAGGAFVVAGCFPGNYKSSVLRFLQKLVPAGAILFAITIISFGILHFMEAKDAATLVPAWIPGHLFWIYFCGAALIGSGISIILKIKTGLFAALLGLMIFLWFILLHIPRVVVAPTAYLGSEVTSAVMALAYSGIAFVIAGAGGRKLKA